MRQSKLCKSAEAGRSMLEMLGVLAIIGVLSVTGLNGYSYVMKRQRISQTFSQINTAMQSARGLFLRRMDDSELNDEGCIPYRYMMQRVEPCSAGDKYAFKTTVGACVAVCRNADKTWRMDITFDEDKPEEMITPNDCQTIMDSAAGHDGFLDSSGKKWKKTYKSGHDAYRNAVSETCADFDKIRLVLKEKDTD